MAGTPGIGTKGKFHIKSHRKVFSENQMIQSCLTLGINRYTVTYALIRYFFSDFNFFFSIREVHSDNEDGAGGGVTGGGGIGGDDDWANFDSFRKQEKVQVRAQPAPKPSIDNVFGNPP